MSIHDLVFFIGTIILIWGPGKMVWSKYTPPISATLTTAIVLTAFMINYGSLHYWWSAIAQGVQVIFWFILVWRGVRKRPIEVQLHFKDDSYALFRAIKKI